MHPLLPLFAVGLDFLFRDAEPWPHPVRIIGRLLDSLEKRAREQSRVSLLTAGWISLFLVCLFTGAITWVVTHLPLLGLIFSLYLAYSGLSLAGLLFAVGAVLTACCRRAFGIGRDRSFSLFFTTNLKNLGIALLISLPFADPLVTVSIIVYYVVQQIGGAALADAT